MQYINLIIHNDAPEPWGLFFQDNATPQMEDLEELHNDIMFYLAIILFAVSWIMINIIINRCKITKSNKIDSNMLKSQMETTLKQIIYNLPKVLLYSSLFLAVLYVTFIWNTPVTYNDSGLNLISQIKCGDIIRTMLSGHPSSLDPGLTQTTGGVIMIDNNPASNTNRLGGIFPNDWNQELSGKAYNTNLGCMLYELKVSGVGAVSYSGVGDPALYNHLSQCSVNAGNRDRVDGCIDLTQKLINYLGNIR